MKWVHFFATVLAYPGAPDFQFRVVAMVMSKGCIFALGKYPLAIDRGRTSLGTQRYTLRASCQTPHCWCFGQTSQGMYLFVKKQLSQAAWASSMDKWCALVVVRVGRLVEDLSSWDSAFASLISFYGLQTWLDVPCSSSLGAASSDRLG